MMNGIKTYLGITIAILLGLAAQLGVEPAVLPEWADTAMLLAGGAIAYFGRWHKERRSPENT